MLILALLSLLMSPHHTEEAGLADSSWKWGPRAMNTSRLHFLDTTTNQLPPCGTEPRDHDHENVPRWPVLMFDFASVITLSLSVCAHTFACMSPKISEMVWRLDQVGVSLGITAAFIPACLLIFHCEPFVALQFAAWPSIMGIACMLVNVSDVLPARTRRSSRLALYFALMLSSILPISQAVHSYWEERAIRGFVLRIGATIAIATVAGIIYLARVPERWFVSVFDFLGHSHQLFHVLVFFAFVLHHFNCWWLWYWWMDDGVCPLSRGCEPVISHSLVHM